MKEDAEHSLESYWTLLKTNKAFRIIWIGEVVNNAGAWFNYVATLTVIERLAGESGLLVSLVLIVRMLPSLLLFPITGVVADRYDREAVLVVSNVIAAAAVACYTLVQRSSEVWLLYVLMFAQCSASSFYDPARRAITPTIVTPHALPLATTLDSFAWSLVGALGASSGGFAVSHLGPNSCFVLDAITYLIAAWCALCLKGYIGDAQAAVAAYKAGELTGEVVPLRGVPKGDVEMAMRVRQQSPTALTLKAVNPMDGHFVGSLEVTQEAAAEQLAEGGRAAGAPEPSGHRQESESLIQARHGDTSTSDRAGKKDALGGKEEDVAPADCWGALMWRLRGEFADLQEGMVYILAPENRDAAAMASIKASGALVWGASDILQVRFSNLPSMHSLGDSATTLGLLFAAVGFGCFIGPIVSNRLSPPRKHYLLRACAVSFVGFLIGYLLMAVAPNIWLLLPATVVRSCGSSIVWVYSTLLIQLRVPNELQGRMMALEMALYVVTECLSAIFAGAAFDGLHLSATKVVLIMAGVSAVIAVAWVAYAVSQWPRGSKDADQPPEQDQEELLPSVSL